MSLLPPNTGRPKRSSYSRRAFVVMAVMAVLAIASRYLPRSVPTTDDQAARVEDLYNKQAARTWVTAEGEVGKLLSDDTRGRRHQRFILRLQSGHTLLVAHNIDLAPRVPAETGDRLTAHGLYEWNSQGGVLHYTHLDPGGDGPGGWLRLKGKTYQ